MTSSLSPDGFEFDPVAHQYRVGGVVVPGITRTLELTGFVDKTWFTDASRKRGTDVHRACWFLAENDLDWGTVKPEYLPRVQAFARFLDDKKPKLVLAEKPLHSTAYHFAGTPDFLFDMGGPVLIDVKTGRAGLAAELQTAGQKVLVEERLGIKGARRFALELPESGVYRLVPCPTPHDTTMFLNAVAFIHRRINAKELTL